jgi:hypothetical protein
MAYIGFEDSEAGVRAAKSVRLEQWADEADADAMNPLILDFDEPGRLIGSRSGTPSECCRRR